MIDMTGGRMNSTTEAQVLNCLLLLRAISHEPSEFFDVIGMHDYDEEFAKGYFEQIASIMGSDLP